MLDTSRADEIELIAEDFSRRDHQLIFLAIMECVSRRMQADAVTVSEVLEKRGQAEQTGGLIYCASIVRDTPSAANIRAYADAVKKRSDAERAKRIAQSLIEEVDREPEAIDVGIRELM